MVPIRISAWVLALSRLTWVVAPLPIRSLKRLTSRCAPSSCAWSLASMPSACSIWASIWRLSSVNNRSFSATLAPSSKCTDTMVVSTRDFSATLEIGVTVPIESTSTGTDLRSALASSTETRRGPCGPWAVAPLPIHDERVAKAATATMPMTPAKTIKLFFFIIFTSAARKGRDDGFRPLDGDFCALFLDGYHRLAAHGMPAKRKCVVTIRVILMRIATWNVNSVRQRIEHLVSWLRDCSPDIVCLQEIKCVDDAFPRLEIEALGYNVVTHGQKTFNGVALLSKLPFEETKSGLAGDDEDAHARFLEVVVTLKSGVVRIACLYLPNGNPVNTAKYPYKLKWMSRLLEYSRERLKTEEPLVLAGDFNVIPAAPDLHNPAAWVNDALFRPQTRACFQPLLGLGLTDALRAGSDEPGQYTFWDYQADAWQQNWAIRTNHLRLPPQTNHRLIASHSP